MSTSTATKERPILFSGPMVRALLAGTKTQTRRVVKLPRGFTHDGDGYALNLEKAWKDRGFGDGEYLHVPTDAPENHRTAHRIGCPYGVPGDVLVVRESIDAREPVAKYVADGTPLPAGHSLLKPKLIPSIHMPHWACRLRLEVVSLRAERMQEISDADAMAEGIMALNGRAGGKDFTLYGLHGWDEFGNTPRDAFEILLEKVGRSEAWKSNAWTWVVEVRRQA